MAPLVSAAAMFVLASAANAAERPQSPGKRIAQAYCSGCHAIGRSGASPLADAPPMRELGRRGDLMDLLSEGMITTPGVQEEGERRRHPRMPAAPLDEAQLSDLLAYLRSIQTGPAI
jgi:cytochrome c